MAAGDEQKAGETAPSAERPESGAERPGAGAERPAGAGAPLAVGFDGIVPRLAPVTIVCGHYGVGKTSLAVSLAIDAVRAGYDAVLSDLDVVNPYFRSSDYKAVLDAAGVRLIEPVYARSNVDGPSVTNETAGAVEWARADAGEGARPRILIIDAGGDDAGATVLGRFSAGIKAAGYEMLYVVNRQRGFDHTPQEAVGFLREIEEASHLTATAVAGNTHLKADTELATVEEGIPFARACAEEAGLPLRLVTLPKGLEQGIADRETSRIRQTLCGVPLYAMGLYVRAPWE